MFPSGELQQHVLSGKKVTKQVCHHFNLGPVVQAGLGSSVTSHMVWSAATLIEMWVPEELLSEGYGITQMSNCVPLDIMILRLLCAVFAL